jgi:divalent metal cation (Fe/Co/Zn/Cd) transporter
MVASLRRERLLARGLWLEYVTLGWNVVGSVVVVTSAIAAHSVALAGFGIDSLIEIFASVVVVWQLKGVGKDRERVALRLIGVAFILLALYVLAQSTRTLFTQEHPATSPLGIAWLAATLVAMLLLSQAKRITGKELGNPVLTTEAQVTLVDAYLAAAVLLGLVLNVVASLWWADPLAGLVIVYYGAQKGWEAIHASN